MDDRIKEIRKLLGNDLPEREMHIRELEEQISQLHPKLEQILDTLSYEDRTTLEGYLFSIAELELYTVNHAFRRGKALGIQIGTSRTEKQPPRM